MKQIYINKNLSLTFSAKENERILKEHNISYIVSKNSLTKKKEIVFFANLLDTEEMVAISFNYGLINRIIGIDQMRIVTKKEYDTDCYSDNSFKRIESILEDYYGQPNYCKGTDEFLIFLRDNLEIIHSVYEVRMGWSKHSIKISKKINFLRKNVDYEKFLNMKKELSRYFPSEFNLVHFFYYKNKFRFVFETQDVGIAGFFEHKLLSLYPYKISKRKNDNGFLEIRQTPIKEINASKETDSIEEALEFINNYVNENRSVLLK